MNETLTPAQSHSTAYDQVDFKSAYEKLFAENQNLQRRLQQALDQIEYLKSENEKLRADNVYLKKMLFAQKSEKSKKKLQKHPQTISSLAHSLLM